MCSCGDQCMKLKVIMEVVMYYICMDFGVLRGLWSECTSFLHT